MHPFFEITSVDIQQLDDEQARELVARLCKAELRSKGIGTSPVTWGGDQRAKDGGVDVRVDITPATGISGYVPKDSTAYQVKAESFSPAKILAEMAPKDLLRPVIVELTEKSGAYVIVSTKDSCSDIFLKKRKKAMLECAKKHDLAESIHLDFYDSQKMADWAGNYPGVLVWLRSILGKPIQGWKPYGPWAYQETSVEDEYLLDDKVKVFAPNNDEAISVTNTINQLRGELIKIGTSARIVGLSGVGKTRLIQALFDHRIQTAAETLNQENILYTDLSNNPTPQPIAMLEALIQDGTDCVVIVDNCGQDVHRKLTEIIQRPESKIRLVTVEYDIRDDLPDGTTCYRLEGSSGDVITKLLKRHYQTLSDLDIDKIVEFSDGNARVALALASTSEAKGELAQLRDDELFKRLFIQKNTESNELLRCAEAASLLYSFDNEDTSEKSELAVLSAAAEVTIATFYRNVSELQKRGLVQARGKWRAVLPHAISNRLAINAFQFNHPNLLVQRFVTDASERVARSFSRRLGYLHESKHAQQIVENWLEPDGLLGEVSSLSTLKREILENISPVNQRAALNALCHSIEKVDFVSVDNLNRAHFARLIRSLAYEPDLFDDAVSALLKFTLAEPDDYKSDSVREILQSLFLSHFSGTLAAPKQRAIHIRQLAFSEDKKKQKLALNLLHTSLQTYHFSSNYSFDFGARKRTYGWYPRTIEEFREWYSLFIHLAVELGKIKNHMGFDARCLLGATFRGLWGDPLINEILTSAAREFQLIDGWPDGWIGIRNTLRFDKSYLVGTSLKQLESLDKELEPRDLRTKIQAKILSRGIFGVDLEDEPELNDSEKKSSVNLYYRAQEEAEILGKAAALDEAVLSDLVPYITNKRHTNKPYYFGIGVGQELTSVPDLLDRARGLIYESKEGFVDLQFIFGVITGWSRTRPDEVSTFLDNALDDEVWGPLFPNLQLTVELDQSGYSRLIKSLEIGRASCSQYTNLCYARRTDPLTVKQIAALLTLLSTMPDGGLSVAIDVLYMVIHCTDSKDEQYKEELRVYCLEFVGELDFNLITLTNENFLHHLELVIEFALDSNDPYEVATKTLNRLIQLERSGKRIFPRRLGSILLPFFKKCPIETLDAIFASNGESTSLMHMLTVRLDRQGETAMEVTPEESLIEWCKASPEDRCVFAARACKLFEIQNSGAPSDVVVTGISSVTKALLALAPDKKKVLEILVDRFHPRSWSGSLAAIMRQRLKHLDELNQNADQELELLIDETKVQLSKSIENIEQREQKRERSDNARFE